MDTELTFSDISKFAELAGWVVTAKRGPVIYYRTASGLKAWCNPSADAYSVQFWWLINNSKK